jgi:hypothetical protein
MTWVVTAHGFTGTDNLFVITLNYSQMTLKWSAQINIGQRGIMGAGEGPEEAIIRAYQNMRVTYGHVLDAMTKIEIGIFGKWQKDEEKG